jgi:hypothetical protein
MPVAEDSARHERKGNTPMKILFLTVLAAFGFVFAGSMAAAESPTPLAPLVVQVTSIVRDFDYINVQTPQTQEGDRSEQAGLLTLFFQTRPGMEEKSLFNEALKSARVLHVVDGTNLLAECMIAGTAFHQRREGGPLFGLILKFGSVDDAERAAGAMREDLVVSIRRKLENRRSWRL